MSIIDSLLVTEADEHFVRKFNNLRLLGLLSEWQIAYGKAIIADPTSARFDVARAAAETRVAERFAHRKAEAVAKAARAEARRLAGPSAAQLAATAKHEAEVAAMGLPAFTVGQAVTTPGGEGVVKAQTGAIVKVRFAFESRSYNASAVRAV